MSSRRQQVVATLFSTALVFALTGCGDNDPSASTDHEDDGSHLALSGDWRLVSGEVDGRDLELQTDYPVTLTVDGAPSKLRVAGQSGCNHYGSMADVSGAELTLSDVGSTLMGCAEAVLSLETNYLAGLADITAYEQTADRLVLTGPRTRLTFEPLPPIPTAELVDTVWRLESIVSADVASSVTGEPTLQLRGDGSFEMTSGCGLVLAGDWTEWNGAITFTSFSASGGCQQHPQSKAILAVSDSFYVEVDGDRLTVTGRHGGALVYRADSSTR